MREEDIAMVTMSGWSESQRKEERKDSDKTVLRLPLPAIELSSRPPGDRTEELLFAGGVGDDRLDGLLLIHYVVAIELGLQHLEAHLVALQHWKVVVGAFDFSVEMGKGKKLPKNL